MNLTQGSDRCRCAGCGLYFNSTAAFDKHRVGAYSTDRRCLTITEMADKGFAQNFQGYWIGSKRPFTLQFQREESAAAEVDRLSMERAHGWIGS